MGYCDGCGNTLCICDYDTEAGLESPSSDLNYLMSEFISERGLYNVFTDWLKLKGYTDNDIEEMEDNL